MNIQDTSFFSNGLFFDKKAPFTDSQKAWLNGYFSGLSANIDTQDTTNTQTALVSIHILYGSQTGSAEGVAHDMAARCADFGLSPTVAALEDIAPEELVDVERLMIVTSTYGEGEMPDNAQIFWERLSATTQPRLERTHFSIFALGDTSYDGFCEAGKLLDIRLEQLGAQRIAERIDCDVDYEDLATGWIENTLPEISKYGDITVSAPRPTKAETISKPRKSKWTRRNPYHATLKTNRLLSTAESEKEIRHYEFLLEDEDLQYEAGDALSIIPINNDFLVNNIIEALGAPPDQKISPSLSLFEALKTKYEIVTPSKGFLSAVAQKTDDAELIHIVRHADKEALENFLWNKDVLDILTLYPEAKFSADEFLDLLRPLIHRAYSISSSSSSFPGEVHLTISTVRWDSYERRHGGVCSTFLTDMLQEGDKAQIFFSLNKAFRVPENDTTPMIMIGPGTGIAPFRAFLQERQTRGATGFNWLFFGDQHKATDFIYADELAEMQENGLLHQLDLAFSRDQNEKVYVQHKMLAQGAALFAKLEEGGYLYVCGDATRMAKDVDAALHTLIETHGHLSQDAAIDYVNNLKQQKRYLRDVY